MLKAAYKNQNDGGKEYRNWIKGNKLSYACGRINLNVIEGKAYDAVREKEGKKAAEDADKNAACDCTVNGYIKGIGAD